MQGCPCSSFSPATASPFARHFQFSDCQRRCLCQRYGLSTRLGMQLYAAHSSLWMVVPGITLARIFAPSVTASHINFEKAHLLRFYPDHPVYTAAFVHCGAGHTVSSHSWPLFGLPHMRHSLTCTIWVGLPIGGRASSSPCTTSRKELRQSVCTCLLSLNSPRIISSSW